MERPDTNHYYPDPLRDGYIALMFGANAQAYLTALFDGTPASSIRPLRNGGQMVILNAPQSMNGWILDYLVDPSLGTVIRQRLYVPTGSETIIRHVTNANLQKPIFFIMRNGSVGISLNLASAGQTFDVIGEQQAANFGGVTTTHICINWIGYSEFKKQVEVQDSYKQPITISRLISRIGRRVDDFLNDIDAYFNSADRHWQHDPLREWRAGPMHTPEQKRLLREQIHIIGMLHVSRGVWQPILELRGRYNLPIPSF